MSKGGFVFGYGADILYNALAEHDKTAIRLLDALKAGKQFTIEVTEGTGVDARLHNLQFEKAPEALIEIVDQLAREARVSMVDEAEAEATAEAEKLAGLIEKVRAARETPIQPPPPPKPPDVYGSGTSYGYTGYHRGGYM